MTYTEFIASKSQWKHEAGFTPSHVPEFLFDFQRCLFEYACRKGRCAIFADCGMGKTAIELAFANELIQRCNKPVLLLTPLAVGQQVVSEARKFGVEARRSRGGEFDGSKCVWVTNYEQLDKFNPDDFCGVIADESSRIKDAKSATKHTVTEFMRRMEFRLLCTATAAPNDYHELGTSSEALGLLGFRDMITTFFKQEQKVGAHGWGRTKYRFRGHAMEPFWAWVCSWARSCRMPSDLGFDDGKFKLPELIESEYVVATKKARPGMLFAMAGRDLNEQRAERRNSISERCEMAESIAQKHDGHSVVWCELNDEGDVLERLMPESKQVKGSMSDEQKEEYLQAFSDGQIKQLVTKPKLGAWGLNWQHCHNSIHLPSHSYEQYYQSVRRFHRFGQANPVKVSLVVNEGESGVLQSLRRKTEQVNNMFASIVKHMQDAMHLQTSDYFPDQEELPTWLC